MPDLIRLDIENGKYTIIQSERGALRVLRWGETWLDDTRLRGSKMILAMAYELEDLRKKAKLANDTADEVGPILEHMAKLLKIDDKTNDADLLRNANHFIRERMERMEWYAELEKFFHQMELLAITDYFSGRLTEFIRHEDLEDDAHIDAWEFISQMIEKRRREEESTNELPKGTFTRDYDLDQ